MSWHRLKSALRYIVKAQGAGLLHSPFVYTFYETVLDKDRQHYDFEWLEALRMDMESDATVLPIQDFGAGSTTGAGDRRSVQSIAKSAVKRQKYAECMYRLVDSLQPNSILELGTSLGLTTLYMHAACPSARCVTLEGAPALCDRARNLFDEVGSNIEVIQGAFDETLPGVAQQEMWDLVFIDGNHRKEATLKAVETLWPGLSETAVVVIDDIYWSPGMTEAWNTLKANDAFTLSMDVFEMGLLFKGRPMEKQHFVLRY